MSQDLYQLPSSISGAFLNGTLPCTYNTDKQLLCSISTNNSYKEFKIHQMFHHNFVYRYDSGIFLLQYLRNYKGLGMEGFPNARWSISSTWEIPFWDCHLQGQWNSAANCNFFPAETWFPHIQVKLWRPIIFRPAYELSLGSHHYYLLLTSREIAVQEFFWTERNSSMREMFP